MVNTNRLRPAIQIQLPFDGRIEITARHGEKIYVDVADADLINRCWHLTNRGYVGGNEAVGDGTFRQIIMHRVIMSRMLGRELERRDTIDHVDGNKLNNTRSNLRLATRSQNGANTTRQVNNTSGYKGVSWHKASGKWSADITKDYRRRHLGVFETPEEAHKAYKAAAMELYGEFARFE